MKQLYSLIAILFFSFTAAQARPVITFTALSGNWSTASNWDLNRLPTHGDSIVIPESNSVLFDKSDTLANVYIKVIGGLTIEKKMKLNVSSVIELTATGELTASGANRNVEVITINGVNKYDQNASLSVFGLAYATAGSGVSPNGFSVSLSTLPVVFNSFYVTKSNNNVILSWSTAREYNNRNFELQRSFDGSNWSVMAIMMGAGTSENVQRYNYTDKNMTAAVAYYRIRQVDLDGKFEYSTVKTIRANEATPASRIYSNGNTVNVEFNQEIKNPVTVRIVNMNGQVIAQRVNQQSAYRFTINLNDHITGMHMVQLNDNAGWNEVKKIVL